MRIIPFDAPKATGKLIIVYGETGVGKTTSYMESLKKYPELLSPGLVLVFEQRNAELSAEAVDLVRVEKHGGVNYVIVVYESFDELISFMGEIEELITVKSCGVNYVDIKSICADGVTQLMTNLGFDVADSAAESRAVENKTSSKSFIADTKLSKEGYGAIGNHMLRFWKLLVGQTQLPYNKYVIVNALLEDANVLWNNLQRAVPSFAGNMFPRKYPGLCDFIGLVEPRYKNIKEKNPVTGEMEIVDKIKVYPPWIKFEEDFDDDGEKRNFQCKWTGKTPTKKGVPISPIKLRLDYSLIFNPSTEKEGNNQAEKQVSKVVDEVSETTKFVADKTIQTLSGEVSENTESQDKGKKSEGKRRTKTPSV